MIGAAPTRLWKRLLVLLLEPAPGFEGDGVGDDVGSWLRPVSLPSSLPPLNAVNANGINTTKPTTTYKRSCCLLLVLFWPNATTSSP